MSTKYEGRSSHYELIDDIVESSSPKKTTPNRINSNYSSLPSSLNKIEQPSIKRTYEPRDRLYSTLPRSSSSLIMMSNDQRREEIDLIIRNLYNGKLMTTPNDNHSEPIPNKTEKDKKNHVENHDLLPHDGDLNLLQRELQEKELDIIHLRKEIQELQLENKVLKSKGPTVHSNGHTSNNHENEALRREKEILQNELRTAQELLGKFQQSSIINRSNKIDQIAVQQKQALEQKLKTYEKQMRVLINENEKSKRNSLQTEGVIGQLKRDKEDLQQKLNEAKKRNDELFYQEFNALRNDLKMLKQRNNELFDENLRLQQQRPNPDLKHLRVDRSESPNVSEASDSTNYLTSVTVERYNTRRSGAINGNSPHHPLKYSSSLGQDDINRNKSKPIDQLRSSKTKRSVAWDEENIHSNEGISKYDESHQSPDESKSQYYPTHHSESQHYSRRILNLDNSPDDRRPTRRHTDTISPRRPYAPLSISDVHLNDIIKFSRPGGKISKGVVKYIGTLPDKTDQYLGLELEDEESKHDGIYQDHRFFHCKPNKGVFVAFNKVIMAWSER